jgi:hypothetical protein
MIYLGNPCTDEVRDEMDLRGWLGCMVTPGQGNAVRDGWDIAIDNARFAEVKKPGSWPRAKWLDTLAEHRGHTGCRFAVVPDVVGNAAATTAWFDEWAPIVAAFGYPLAYATQNGCTSSMVPWDHIACLFNGGDDQWKDGPESYRLTREAQERGIWTHMGRVNSPDRAIRAARHGYDSVDGTYLTYGPDTNLPKLRSFIRRAHRLAEHPTLNEQVFAELRAS